jgi:hypothetical protein
MALITWVILNVTSIIVPFDLSNGFYSWAYAIPAHEVYQVLIDIWSGGCNPQLYYALPILFSLEITGLILSGLGVFRRCHYAAIAEEAQEAAFQERLNAKMEFERKRDIEREEERRSRAEAEKETTPEELERAETRERREMGEVVRKVDTKIEREKQAIKSPCSFGPAFELPGQRDES